MSLLTESFALVNGTEFVRKITKPGSRFSKHLAAH